MKKKISILLALCMLASVASISLCGFAPNMKTQDEMYASDDLYGAMTIAEDRNYYFECEVPATLETYKIKGGSPNYTRFSNGYCGPIAAAQVFAMADVRYPHVLPDYASNIGTVKDPILKPLDSYSINLIEDFATRMGASVGNVTYTGFWNGFNSKRNANGLSLLTVSCSVAERYDYSKIKIAINARVPVVLFAYQFELLDNIEIGADTLRFNAKVYKGNHIMVADSINYMRYTCMGVDMEEVWIGIMSQYSNQEKTYLRLFTKTLVNYMEAPKVY